jgi:ribonuclease-3
LQEFLQGRKIALPTYEVIDTTGQSHNQQFTVRCQTSITDDVVIAKGTSRRKAEQQAAEQILLLIEQANLKNQLAKKISKTEQIISTVSY